MAKPRDEPPPADPHDAASDADLHIFRGDIVDRVRAAGGVWRLPGGRLRLPRRFGFCRGVTRALTMLQQAVAAHESRRTRLVLLGQVIHNPWVNDYFVRRGATILTEEQREDLERHLHPTDCAVIPAFGVPLPVQRRLQAVGCEIVDTTCGDVRRLWAWAERAVRDGYGVLVFGRARHDETVVTKSRLAAAGGSYVVAGDRDQVRLFCEIVRGVRPAESFREVFDDQATNARDAAPFLRLAQVSQTTMLYDETLAVRELITSAFAERFGPAAKDRLLFQPTVCQATQNRQAAAVELCRAGCDLVIVVGGLGSSNTRHLFELASRFAPAYFIEDADALTGDGALHGIDPDGQEPATITDWLPTRRPLTIGVLAGASTPEAVVGEVLQALAAFLG